MFGLLGWLVQAMFLPRDTDEERMLNPIKFGEGEPLAQFCSQWCDGDDATKAIIKAKYSLNKFMNKNLKSVGANVPMPAESMSGVCKIEGFKKARFQDEVGGGTNMSCSAVNTFRTGGGVFPMNGNGVVVLPMDEKRLYLLCFPVMYFLKIGIAMTDFANWTETKSGQEFAKEYMKVVVLTRGDVAFVPAGWIASPLFYEPPPEKSNSKKSKKVEGTSDVRNFGYFASFPLFDPTAFGEKDGGSWPAWTAIETMTTEYWGKPTQDKHGQRWLECFGNFAKLVKSHGE